MCSTLVFVGQSTRADAHRIALNADQLEANFRLQPVTHAGDFVDLLLQMFREKNWFKLDRIQILRKALSDSPDP